MAPDSLSSLQPSLWRASPQQLVTRHNAVMFYAIAAASLLENIVALRSGELMAAFGGDREFCAWLERVWRPAKAAHAQAARTYGESMWPVEYVQDAIGGTRGLLIR